MTKAAESIACPLCGSELSLAQIFSNEESQRAFARLATVSVPLGARVMQYLTLFTPPKTRLTIAKQVRLILQLLPDLERQAITHRGRDWTVPLAAWASAIDQMLAARDAGRLDLPMQGHGYLYAILAGMADKHEGQAEAQREAERRTPARQDAVQVRGQALPIGDALQQVYGQRDPALQHVDRAIRDATPPPQAARDLLAQLKGQKGGAQ